MSTAVDVARAGAADMISVNPSSPHAKKRAPARRGVVPSDEVDVAVDGTPAPTTAEAPAGKTREISGRLPRASHALARGRARRAHLRARSPRRRLAASSRRPPPRDVRGCCSSARLPRRVHRRGRRQRASRRAREHLPRRPSPAPPRKHPRVPRGSSRLRHPPARARLRRRRPGRRRRTTRRRLGESRPNPAARRSLERTV